MRPFAPLLAASLTLACSARQPSGQTAGEALDLADDPRAFVTSAAYRRGVLERDLVDREPIYASARLRRYSMGAPRGWDTLPIRDWSSRPLTLADAEHIHTHQALPTFELDPPMAAAFGTEAEPTLPTSEAEWIALGERVFFEFPMAVAPWFGKALRAGDDLRDYGVLVHDDAYVGVRLTEVEGRARVALTCAICHASVGADGQPSGVRSNRNYDLGAPRLAHGGARATQLVDATAPEDLGTLGPGRSDVQRDKRFNPYAFPDFGGIADKPYLHHTANWHNRGVATLAIRIETVFMGRGIDGRTRPPRVLMWALAMYLRSLPPPPPVAEPSESSRRGEQVFIREGCDTCHAPPMYTSDVRVPLDELGTDDAAGTSPIRGTGHWRVPSLRGVGGNAPYLHHGALSTLEQLFDPGRTEPGHSYGLELEEAERADLIAFLRTI